jgi:hypothetical protein
MKLILALALILVSITLWGQDKKVVIRGDSLIVRDENITSNPFNFGRDPLALLRGNAEFTRPVMKANPTSNRHVDNQVDTIFVITFEQDSFRIYKGGDNENFLLYALLKTDRFKTRHGIQVGMTKLQVRSYLEEYNLGAIPKLLILDNTEIIESISLEFREDVLTKIEFHGYSD